MEIGKKKIRKFPKKGNPMWLSLYQSSIKIDSNGTFISYCFYTQHIKTLILGHFKTCVLVENVNFWAFQNVCFGRKRQFLSISKRVFWSKTSIFEHFKTCVLVEHLNFWAFQNVCFGRKPQFLSISKCLLVSVC